ncbi:MAG: ATP phosphoribosyltransferase [Brevinematia bacterium]
MSFVIAVPKGRLGSDVEKLLIEAKILNNPLPENSRKLIFEANENAKIIIVRAWDIPTYVENRTADIGFCGKDDLIEHEADVFEVLDLGFGQCRMVVAGKENIDKEELFSRAYLKVATKYPNVAKKFFANISIQAEIIKLYGSVELAAVMDMCDCIVDIVSTGNTLKENKLKVLENIFESTARLIFNRGSFYIKFDEFLSFKQRILNILEKGKK